MKLHSMTGLSGNDVKSSTRPAFRGKGMSSLIPQKPRWTGRTRTRTCAISVPRDTTWPQESSELVSKTVTLPTLTEDLAKQVLSTYGFNLISSNAKGVFSEKRHSQAQILYPANLADAGSGVPVVIFSHGFSQPVQNYRSTLQKLSEQLGAVVIAPETSLFDTLGLVAGSGKGFLGELTARPPTKMQAALIVDVLRSAGYLRQTGVNNLKLGHIMLVGHSMGAGISVLVAAMLKDIAGVAAEAPAVKQMFESPVNPDIHMNNDLRGQSYKEAVGYFMDRFPDQAKLVLIGGDQDQIVQPLEVAELFTAARTAVKKRKLKDVTLFTVKGSHIGFEDKVSLEVSNPFLSALFWVINFLVYKVEVLKFLLQDYSSQLKSSQYVLVESGKDFFGRGAFPVQPSPTGVYDISEDCKAVKTRSAFEELHLGMPEQGVATIVTPEALAPETPADQEVGKWLPQTGLLLSYSAAHMTTVAGATALILDGLNRHGGSPRAEGGMAVVALLAAALVYDNALLASGRFLGQGPVLEALSSFRYVAHSFAPIIALVAAEQASRTGVAFAGNPFFQGALLLVLAIEVSLSVIQSHFLLELKPLWSNGVLRYGYRDPSISQVLPVITSSVLTIVLGVAAAKDNPAMWPLAGGALASFVLSAIPPSKAPVYLTGNLGEVFLLASMVAAEKVLQFQGL